MVAVGTEGRSSFGECSDRMCAGGDRTQRRGRKKGQADLTVQFQVPPPCTVVALFHVSDGLGSISKVRSGAVCRFGGAKGKSWA